MATLFMLMGVPGSGKTTLARRLEEEHGAFLLFPDEWIERLGLDGYDAKRREVVKALQLEVAESILTAGGDVVLEFGFFSRAERDAVRERALALGSTPQLVFLDAPVEEIWKRLEARNAALPPGTFPVSREHLELCYTWLERPGEDEPVWVP